MTQPIHRDRFERSLNHRIRNLSAKHRRELIELLGNPPDYRRVPPEFWHRVDKEVKNELMTVLVLLWMMHMDSAGTSGRSFEGRALSWARSHATAFGARYASGSRDTLIRKLTSYELEAEKRQERLQSKGVFVPATKITNIGLTRSQLRTAGFSAGQRRGVNLTQAQLEALHLSGEQLSELGVDPDKLDKLTPGLDPATDKLSQAQFEDLVRPVFGHIRAQRIAITEISKGLTAATIALGNAKTVTDPAFKDGVDYIWRLGVCKHCDFCPTMNGVGKAVWGRYSDGPPAHPYCRCYLEIVPAGRRTRSGPPTSRVLKAAHNSGVFRPTGSAWR